MAGAPSGVLRTTPSLLQMVRAEGIKGIKVRAEGIKAVFNQIKAERGESVGNSAPWDRLIWEVAKLCCMNARKMNVAIGQDLLGYQMIELGKSAEDCLHTKIKVCACERGKGCPWPDTNPPAFAVGLLI